MQSQPTAAADGSDSSDSDFDADNDGKPRNKQSLTITDRGKFVLGPQWAVPNSEVAQDMAGCGSARAVVKSVQYSDEHDANFTLTETIDDCDLAMSGGLSLHADPVAPSTPSGLGAGDREVGTCAPLFSCLDCTDDTLPQPRPSNGSRDNPIASQSRRNSNDHYRSISGVIASSQQPDGYETAPGNDYAQRDARHHRGHGQYHYHDHEPNRHNGNRVFTFQELPSRQIRRVKKFHMGSTHQPAEE